MLSSLLESSGLVGVVAGGLFTLLVFSILFLARDQLGLSSRAWQPAITSLVESELEHAGAATLRSVERKSMKALLMILLAFGARIATAADSPVIIRVSPDALHHIQLNFGVLRDSGKRHVSLQLVTGTGAKDSARGVDYSLKYESLVLGSWEEGAPPPAGMVAVKVDSMELWVAPDLLKRIGRSTIELVRLFSSDGKVDENALILQPAAEITVERYDAKNVEQGGAGQPATRSQSKSEGGDKPQPESEGRSR